MDEISATEAARNFSRILDAVEHDGASYRIVRRGVVIAELSPATECSGRDLKAILAQYAPDPGWAEDLRTTRDLLEQTSAWA